MLKLKFFYVFSLLIVAALLVTIVFIIPQKEQRYSEVQRDQLLETENEWIMQFDIINNEGKDTNYTVNILLNEKPYYTQPVLVRSGKSFSYIQHIYRETFKGGNVTFAVYKEGESTPIEETTYFVKFAQEETKT